GDGTDLDLDGDKTDRVLQIMDVTKPLSASNPFNTQLATADFVTGDAGLVAFRVLECAQHGTTSVGCPTGGTDLNHDGDAADGVLQVYDAATGQIVNSGQAVTPCLLEACDPRVPYRVLKDTVKFLTFE